MGSISARVNSINFDRTAGRQPHRNGLLRPVQGIIVFRRERRNVIDAYIFVVGSTYCGRERYHDANDSLRIELA